MASIHHVTAISGAPLRTLKFYRELLGLRLVKKTVNFDDPGTHHLYYGDESGAPYRFEPGARRDLALPLRHQLSQLDVKLSRQWLKSANEATHA
jgi:catechol 2,3-dioxygenase-like lactoylglutathione lyase family enzyme